MAESGPPTPTGKGKGPAAPGGPSTGLPAATGIPFTGTTTTGLPFTARQEYEFKPRSFSGSSTRSSAPLEVPDELEGSIDADFWGQLGSLLELPNLTLEQGNTLVGTLVAKWDRKDLWGKDLQSQFSRIFEDWEKSRWTEISSNGTKVLRHALMNRGVFVGLVHQSARGDLAAVAARDSFRIWTAAEVRVWQEKSPKFVANLTEARLNEITKDRWRTLTSGGTAASAGAGGGRSVRQIADTFESTTPSLPPVKPPPPSDREALRDWMRVYGPVDLYGTGMGPRTTTPDPAPGPAPAPNPAPAPAPAPVAYPPPPPPPLPAPIPVPWVPPPAHPVGYEQPTSKQILDFEKMYSTNNDNKFGGSFYDVLGTKIEIFRDYMDRLSIPPGCAAALFPSLLKDRAKEFYYTTLFTPAQKRDFNYLVSAVRGHFDTEEARQFYLSEWRSATLISFIAENPSKSKLECLDLLLDKLTKLQQSVASLSNDQSVLRDQALNACREIPECSMALYSPAPTYEGVRNQLRNAISVTLNTQPAHHQFHTSSTPTSSGDPSEQYWVDRTYKGRGREKRYGRGGQRGGRRGGYRGFSRREKPNDDPRCYVCKKKGCWSNNHSIDERQEAYGDYKRKARDPSRTTYGQFIAWHEGGPADLEDEVDPVEQFFQSDSGDDDCPSDSESDAEPVSGTHFTTTVDPVDAHRVTTLLCDASVRHYFTKEDPYDTEAAVVENSDGASTAYLLDDRYSSTVFQGILPDTGASNYSTGGEPQFKALQRLVPSTTLDVTKAGKATIRFGQGDAITSIGKTTVSTPIGPIQFHVVPCNTPFLLCLKDMDRLGIQFNNLSNQLIKAGVSVPVVRKWGHPWLLLTAEETLAHNYLTEVELRRLHRRFGHPSVARMQRLLTAAGHKTDTQTLEWLTKVCHQCQLNAPQPHRFKFTLKDEYDFNYEVLVDIMYLEGKPVLHVIDDSTAFGAARFLRKISTECVWEALRLCWIDTYLGPPDWIVTDQGKQFISADFKALAKGMAISVKEVPIEAHHSIGKVERYHGPLRRAYKIIRAECPDLSPEVCLQMAMKAVNDTAGVNGIVPTLLVFGAYPRMVESSAPAPTLLQRAKTVKKAMEAVRQAHARRQVADALATRNGPSTVKTTTLPLQSQVRVWREKKGWKGPYTLIGVNGEDVILSTKSGPKTFRSTAVKPYYTDPEPAEPTAETATEELPAPTEGPNTIPEPHTELKEAGTGVPVKRGRGRPKGSKNKTYWAGTFFAENDAVFLSAKEKADAALALELRADGKIVTTGKPFEESRQAEVDGLVQRGVFEFIKYNGEKHGNERIFKSRMVDEIKGKNTDKPYEKSRLIIQGYNDEDKTTLLTQSPTIQRASQRVIMAITPTLLRQGFLIWLRDITQAYTQSETPLARTILAKLPQQLRDTYAHGTIMRVVRPLYGIAEAGTHWWSTYHRHHIERLSMVTSSYDPCLLISAPENLEFAVIGMQTDDTLGLSTEAFSHQEEENLEKAQFRAKPKQFLAQGEPLTFNGGTLAQKGNDIAITQKGQGQKLCLVNVTADDAKQQYMRERARGAYIASICQPEACYDLSVAAQSQEPTVENMKLLNKRIKWQMENLDRGLTFVPLDLQTAKLFIFVDGSFANNTDLSSQLGFAIILANETPITEENDFTITGNLIHFSSTKSKRVTRSVLASEVYGMVAGVDMGYAIGSTLKQITDHLKLPAMPMVVCTDSYSLYECLVKLGTTKEKRLMIDIMALRQSYERREIAEVRWIDGNDNLADAFTKASPNNRLQRFVETNTASMRVEGWVLR